MNDVELNFCGHPLSAGELTLIGELVRRHQALSRNELAHTVCELLHWRRPNGGLKTAECRLLLERLNERSSIDLPALRHGRPRGAPTAVVASCPAKQSAPLNVKLSAVQPVQLQRVEHPEQRTLWRELIEHHHYLGHRVPFGAHLRYLIAAAPRQGGALLGCLQFSSPAWRMQARDRWIGWDDQTRARHLQRIINNSRFLLLPWVNIKNLASHVLALALRRVITDWQATYGIRPYLAETLVDPAHNCGHCYRAANWLEVGQTSGRGRQDRNHRRHGAAPKRVFLYPLVSNPRQRLQQTQ